MKLSSIILENKKRISLTYTDPGSTLYSISIDGEKQRGADAARAIEMIQKITGLEVPTRASYFDKEVQAIVDALKAKGYDADVYPMDVS